MMAKQLEGRPGDRIGDLRTSLGMTKKELSRKTGIDASQITRIENGSLKTISSDYLIKLAGVIYALPADETRPALVAPRHTNTALFSRRFKCPCPPSGNGIFTATLTERITHYTLRRKVVFQRGYPFGNPCFVGKLVQPA